MLRRDQQWTAAEEAALGAEPVIGGGAEAGMPPGWGSMSNSDRELHAMRVRAQRNGGAAGQAATAAPASAPQLDEVPQHIQVIDFAFRDAVTTDAPQFRQAVGARSAATARAALRRMVGRISSAELAFARARTLAVADPSLTTSDRSRQDTVLAELARVDQLLRGMSGVLVPSVAPTAFLTSTAAASPPALSASAPAHAISSAGEGTVRVLQTAEGISAILGSNPAAATEDQRRMAGALALSMPQSADEAALLREILASRNLASLPGSEPSRQPDMFDLFAGQVGELLMGPGGRYVLPAYLEKSGAKQVAQDILTSIHISPRFAPAIFDEWWDGIKEEWPTIVATMVAFIGAEVLAAVLIASSHPAAVMAGTVIQVVLLTLMIAGAAFEVVQMIGEIITWLEACRDAGGDTAKIGVASQAFCRVMLRAVVAALAAIGGRAAGRIHARIRNRRNASERGESGEGRRHEPADAHSGTPTATTGTFTAAERAVISEARTMLSSPEISQLRLAHARGESLAVRIGSRTVQYEPQLPASGMTMFGENGFLLGPEAFTRSRSELGKTFLHELHRLATSQSAEGVSGELVARETDAAFNFAELAWKELE